MIEQTRERVTVITGASGGIGAALARELARRERENRLVLVARREKELSRIAEECGAARTLAVVADLTVEAESARVVAAAVQRFGGIDVWINNVGRGITRNPSELTSDDLDAMMLVNVKTAVYGSRAVLAHFRPRGSGHIVTISSVLGRMPFAIHRSAYNGAKHFLNAFVANLRDELAATDPGILVSLVSPGAVRTDFGSNALHGGIDSWKLPDAQSAEEVAEIIANVIERPQSDIYTKRGHKESILNYYSKLTADPGE